MSHAPKFSVIIPTFNSEKAIDSAIGSILEQDWPHEIWVIDGKSTDSTVDRLKACGVTTLRWLSEPDTGIYDAINKGLVRCTGDLIGILGSDDRYATQAFARVAEKFRAGDFDIVAGGTGLVAADGSITRRQDEAYGPGALISGIPFGHNAMFVTPRAHGVVGLYDLRYRICSDAHWVHRAIKTGLSCGSVDEIVVNFSMLGTSSTNDREIMDEAYRVICENFPGLRPDEAKVLLFAVRRWGGSHDVPAILQRLDDPELRRAVTFALPALGRGPAPLGVRRRMAAALTGWLGQWRQQ